MAALDFVDRTAGEAVLADVRSDTTDTNWALFGYQEGSKHKLDFISKGSGGHSEVVSHFAADKIFYALLRVNDNFDNHTAVKFVFIIWVGDKVKATQRALTATHKGDVTAFIGQHHVALYASTQQEIAENVIMGRVTDASGSSNRVLTEDKSRVNEVKSAGTGATKREVGGAGSGNLEFQNEEEIQAAIKSIRIDGSSNNWVLVSYQGNTNTVALSGQGSGGVDELVSHLQDDGISYGLVKVTDIIDEHTTIKFVLIIWVGDSIPAVRKAKITTHKGAIDAFFGQHHNDIYVSHKNEISTDLILSKVRDASGSGNRVLADTHKPETVTLSNKATTKPAEKKKPAVISTATTPAATGAYRGAQSGHNAPPKVKGVTPGVPKESAVVTFNNEDNIKSVLQSVRKDTDAINWVLVGYQGTDFKVLELISQGSGGFNELKSKISDVNTIYYGLLRVTEQIDDTTAVKFVFITYLGEKVPGVKKARITTQRGAITEFFGQYHVDVTVSNQSELTEDLIKSIVQAASGTKSNIRV